MTIAISLKVHDGVVLAADSASTLIQVGPDGTPSSTATNVYNNANKIFNLKKGLPVGAITWGCGSIGPSSTSTLAKDFRRQLDRREGWKIGDVYTVEIIAANFFEFIYTEHYVPAFSHLTVKPALGFIVAGFSSDGGLAEEYRIDIDSQGNCAGPQLLRSGQECGLNWNGVIGPVSRLVLGYDPFLANVLVDQLGVPTDQVGPILQLISQNLNAPIVNSAMPIMDAIDLATFLVDVAIKFTRFMPGAQTVGGPIEVATITRHEGFKWIQRKHYYTSTLNPREDI